MRWFAFLVGLLSFLAAGASHAENDASILVRFEAGEKGSDLAPRYSPKGYRVTLAGAEDPAREGVEALSGRLLLGPEETRGDGHLVVLARSAAGKPYDRLWIDANGDGSLEDEKTQAASPRVTRGTLYTSYDAVVQVNHGSVEEPAWEPYPIGLWVAVASEEVTPPFIRYSRRGFLPGSVTIGEVGYSVVLSDANNDAVYGTGDWWAVVPAAGGGVNDIAHARKVGDFGWAGRKAYRLELEGTRGRVGHLVTVDPGLTPEEDARARDRFWDDKHAERGEQPVLFRRDVEEAIADARATKALYFLDFETVWCGPCKNMDLWVYTAKDVVAATDGIVCIKVDADERGDLKGAHAVEKFPTGILYLPDGTEVARFTGYRSCKDMVGFFAKGKDATDLARRIADVARPYLEADLFVGAVVGIVKDGERHVVACGTLSVGDDDVPDGDTIYEIGSISKVFTGVLLADFVREDKVEFDQTAASLLPDGVRMPKAGKHEVTLLDLATHTSGLPRMPPDFEPADVGNPFADCDATRLYAYLNETKLDHAPGKKYAYSNMGMGLLGTLLARVNETDYETMLRTRILDPLGMKATTITLGEEHRKHLAPGHTIDLEPAGNWDLGAFAGAGAIRSTVNDMLRFAEANLASAGPLHASLAAAREIRFFPGEGKAPRLGLGWHAGKRGSPRWHNGQTGGYHAFLTVRPDDALGVVVLSNTATGQVDAFAHAVVNALLGKPVKSPKARKTVDLSAEVLDEYPGTYRLSPDFALTITREDGRLYLQATNQPKVRIHAAGDDVFFLRIVKAEVHFVRGASGAVESLVLHQNGQEIPGPRE